MAKRTKPWQEMEHRVAEKVLPPLRTRRQALVRNSLGVTALAVVSYGPSVFELVRNQEPSEVSIGFALLGGLAMVIFPAHSCHGEWPARRGTGQDAHLLTAKTLTGWRTIDLDQIMTIRFRDMGVRDPAGRLNHLGHYVIVRDANRVRIGIPLRDELALGWLREAATSPGTRTRISARAGTAMGLDAATASGYPTCGESGATWYAIVIFLALFAGYMFGVDALLNR
ncbi:hypothetical protein AB0J90_27375 [Micromonospora sp. NPDC049523]|uniref:hypothetical protein n=1 Tax=Micromonospora sp. NPDC049523 TaxID=3155921 RepID=UPI003442F446